MNRTFQGFLFDGHTLAARPVTLTVAAGRLHGAAPEPVFDVSLADVQASDRLADVPRYLYLPEGRSIETADNAAVDALLSGQRRGRLVALIHALEIHSRAAAVATVLLVACTVGALWWGLPVLALRAAQAVPESIELQMGEAGLLAINRFLPDSKLDKKTRSRVQAQLDRLTKVAGIKQKPRLVFRSMGQNAPNAFALPGGIIIISDELVNLAETDEEIAAVLAHETGHWQRRHGIQGVLRSSAALLVVSTVTGDLSALTTFASTLPFALLQNGYSREFEGEADLYAVNLLRRTGIDPESFASMLEKLEKSRPEKGKDVSYLETHPSTRDRIKWIAPGFVPGRAPKPPVKAPGSDQDFTKIKLGEPVKSEHLDRLFKDSPVTMDSLKKPPQALSRRAPSYPLEMREKSIGGTVVIEFIIDVEGNVQSARVVRSTRREFEEEALAAVKEWKFIPGEKGGRKVAVRAAQLLEFNPSDAEVPATSPATETPPVPPAP